MIARICTNGELIKPTIIKNKGLKNQFSKTSLLKSNQTFIGVLKVFRGFRVL